MEKKILFIYNPNSGRELIREYLSYIVETFNNSGYDVTVKPTQYAGQAREIAKEHADDFNIIACAGGDGTLNEVLGGVYLSGSKTPVGYIPTGSTNDFANTHQMHQDVLKAANRIVKGRTKEIDLGLFNGKPFDYVAAFGLFTSIAYNTPHDLKSVMGHSAYFLEIMRSFAEMKEVMIKCELEDGEIIEGYYIIGLMSNSNYIGGMQFFMDNELALDDGEMEFTLIKKGNDPVQFGNIIRALMENTQTKHVVRRKTSKVRISFENVIPWTLDGEYGGSVKYVDLEVVKKAVKIIV